MLFQPYELTIENFMSFGNVTTKVRLDFDQPTLIVGRNYDSTVDGQVDSNGAGKTTILNAINYALFGKIISDKTVNADDLINNINKKNMYVSLIFSVGEDTFYKIERYRKHKAMGGNGVRIFERHGGNWNDPFEASHDITPDSVANADDKIKNLIGLSFDVFSRIVAFSASHKPFLSLPVSEQTAIIEDVTGLTELSEKAEELKKRSKEHKSQLEHLQEINNTIKTQSDQVHQQIESTKKKVELWETNRISRIAEIKLELAKLEANEFDKDKQLELIEFLQQADTKLDKLTAERKNAENDIIKIKNDIKKKYEWEEEKFNKIKELEEKLANLDNIDFDQELGNIKLLVQTNDEVKTTEVDISNLKSLLSTLDDDIKKKKVELEHLNGNTCHYCGQHYKDAKKRAVEVLVELENLKDKKNEVELVLDEKELNLSELKASVERLKKACRFETEGQLYEYSGKIRSTQEKLENLNNQKNPYDIDAEKAEGEIREIEDFLLAVDKSIAKLETKRKKAKDECLFRNVQELMFEIEKRNKLVTELTRLEHESNPLIETLRELESIKLEDTKDEEITNLESLIEHEQFLIKLLTKKDSFVRKILLQKSIPFMNLRLRNYLDKLGLPHKVIFQEDLSVKISQLGNTIGFGNLSNGQKARINLALAFTFRDMLQSRFGRLRFCILDECLDVGLGTVGVQLAAKMIKSIAQEEKLAMFVISHRDEIINMFDRTLTVELRSGFSSIVSQ